MGLGNAITNFFIKSPAKWRLTNVAKQSEYVEGQFQPEDFTRNEATNWAKQPLARRGPTTQWVGEELSTFSFKAYFWNQPLEISFSNAFKQLLSGAQLSVDQKIAQLVKFSRYDDRYKRPPTLRLTWGEVDLDNKKGSGGGADVVITSLGGIQYEELWSSGAVKGVSLQISLDAVPDPISILPEDTSASPLKSQSKPVVQGETYESLAKKEYGDPLYGVLLRQEALLAFPPTGSVISLPFHSYFAGKRREPVAYPLKDSDEAIAGRDEMYAARATSYVMPLVMQT